MRSWIRLTVAAATVGLAAASVPGPRAAPTAPAAGTVRIDGPRGAVLSEVDIAVDPLRPDRAVLVSRDFAGAYRSVDAFRSTDGSGHYRGSGLISGRFHGAAADASDPVAAFDEHGHVFAGALVWRYPRHGFEGLIGVRRSNDGGTSFAPPVVAVKTHNHRRPLMFGEHPNGSTTYDKEWIAVDRTGGANDGTLYAAWVRFSVTRRGTEQTMIEVDRSRNGGHHFSRPVQLSGPGRLVLGPRVAVGPRGTVLVVWSSVRVGGDQSKVTLVGARSQDGGRTFSGPWAIGTFRSGRATAASEQRSSQLAALDVTPAGDWLVCWLQAAGSGQSQTECVRSPDGMRWSHPVAVAPSIRGRHELQQVVAAGPQTFAVTFYVEVRGSTDVFLTRSTDGGASFQPALRLAHRSYRLSAFVGDYTGLAAGGGEVVAAYILPRAGPLSPNSIYVTRVAV